MAKHRLEERFDGKPKTSGCKQIKKAASKLEEQEDLGSAARKGTFELEGSGNLEVGHSEKVHRSLSNALQKQAMDRKGGARRSRLP